MRGYMENFVESMQVDGFCENRDGSELREVARWRASGNENDLSSGIFRKNVTASSDTIELRHSIIHQHNVGEMTFVGMNGFQTGAHDFDNFIAALANELSE